MNNIKFWAETKEDAKNFLNYCEASGAQGNPSEDEDFQNAKALFFCGKQVTHQYDEADYFDQHGSKEFFFPLAIQEFEEEPAGTTTNPKTLHGQSNIPLSLFSPLATAYGSLGKLNGKLKYGLSNFVATPVIASIYVDAIRRHLDKWMSGEECDSADGVPHFGAILANVDILLCARAAGTLVDDRPAFKGYVEEIAKLTPIVKNLHELHKDKNPVHYLLKEENGTE